MCAKFHQNLTQTADLYKVHTRDTLRYLNHSFFGHFRSQKYYGRYGHFWSQKYNVRYGHFWSQKYGYLCIFIVILFVII